MDYVNFARPACDDAIVEADGLSFPRNMHKSSSAPGAIEVRHFAPALSSEKMQMKRYRARGFHKYCKLSLTQAMMICDVDRAEIQAGWRF